MTILCAWGVGHIYSVSASSSQNQAYTVFDRPHFSATSVFMFNFKLTSTLTALAALTGTLAQNPTWTNSLHGPFTPISLNATDGSISAAFIPHGAAITELWVKDRNGTKRDITLGYDNRTLYADDPSHPNFGPIVSRNSRDLDAGTHTRLNDRD
jgi:hypothetical protein